jgi:hypothetical protein
MCIIDSRYIFLFRSRFGEDKAIYDLFFKVSTTDTGYNGEETLLPKGTYIELGAFDGSTESNTMFFDKCLGWDGLLIEGQSDSYEKVILNRPRAVKLSFSPTCENENETVQFHNYPMLNSGLEGSAKTYDKKKWTVCTPKCVWYDQSNLIPLSGCGGRRVNGVECIRFECYYNRCHHD